MKYRIKKVTYKDGEVKYFTQYYRGFFLGWGGINFQGEKTWVLPEVNYEKTREGALKVIDFCDAGKGVVTTIEFEYIDS